MEHGKKHFKKKRQDGRPQFKPRPKKTDLELAEIEKLTGKYSKVNSKEVKSFRDLPLSSNTQKGLAESGFSEPTEIQRESISLALRGLDVLGAAKTGSGKTLAFIIPLLERLFTLRWSRIDGLGAIVITPTRELAYQIFEALRKIGRFHDFSAGLVIGGKDLKFETRRMAFCNIVVCTPGRLLQHMDENPDFNAQNLKILILDEADRCLDMGFAETMNAILQNLPTEDRQTLLFSATQTRSVKDLARLSLQNPLYVSVHENATNATPDNLNQNYMVCDLNQKIDVLWSFIKSHVKKKVLVFMQSCKQVKYISELFRRLRCPATILSLYGTLHQLRRMAIYDDFCQSSQAVLFATDIAARGLDFPAVDWVVQLDCPEDATTYLHRVGRTARLANVGQSLLILVPSEEDGMLNQLRAYKIPIDKIEANPQKIVSIQRKIEANLASDTELKESAQRAFIAYLKSVFLLKNKSVFDVFKLDTDAFAASLGLAVPPRVRFLQKQLKLREDAKNKAKNSGEGKSDVVNKAGEEVKKEKKITLTIDSEDESDDDILTVKRADHDFADANDEDENDEPLLTPESKVKIVTKAALAKKVMKKKIQSNTVTRFDEEGGAVADLVSQKVSEEGKLYEAEEEDFGGINIDKAKMILRAEDKFDKVFQREKIKARKKEEKRKAKEAKKRKPEEDEASSADESDGESVDLSWLPDPDKIYGNDGDNNEKPLSEKSSEESSEDEKPQKQKWKPPKRPKKESETKRPRLDLHQPELPLSKEDILMDEELALQLLRGK